MKVGKNEFEDRATDEDCKQSERNQNISSMIDVIAFDVFSVFPRVFTLSKIYRVLATQMFFITCYNILLALILQNFTSKKS